MSDNPYATPQTQLDFDPAEEGSLPLASRFKRLIARLIDAILQGVIAGILFFVVPGMEAIGLFEIYWLQSILAGEDPVPGWYIFLLLSTGGQFSPSGAISLAIALLIYLCLQGYLLYKYGQTIGKWVVKVRIVDYESNQVPRLTVSFGFREVGAGLFGFIPFGALIDVLCIFGESRRCLHDRWSETKVVDAA